MIRKGPTVYETAYDLLKEELRDVLWAIVESEAGAGDGMGSVPWRACAALYSLLEGHPVDRRGRCRSCRRPGAVLGRARRRCQIRVSACYWLQQPDETLLLGLLARELNQHPAPPAGAGERADRLSLGDTAPAADPAITDLLPDPPSAAMRRPRRLTGTELLDWIALGRVYGGGVAMLGSGYVDHGRPVPCYLPEAFGWLADAELTELLDSDFPGGLRRVMITRRGRARYQQLSAERGPSRCPDQSLGGWLVSAEWPLPRWRPVGAPNTGIAR